MTAGMIDQEGYVHIMSRSDDIINVAAHRLSTGILFFCAILTKREHRRGDCIVPWCGRVLRCRHARYSERCAPMVLLLTLIGHVPLAFITATHDAPPKTILTDLNALVRKRIGGIATLAGVVVLDRIPKTRSGKTLRRVLREIVERGIDGDWQGELAVPATVEDRSHVDWAREKVKVWMESRSASGKTKL